MDLSGSTFTWIAFFRRKTWLGVINLSRTSQTHLSAEQFGRTTKPIRSNLSRTSQTHLSAEQFGKTAEPIRSNSKKVSVFNLILLFYEKHAVCMNSAAMPEVKSQVVYGLRRCQVECCQQVRRVSKTPTQLLQVEGNTDRLFIAGFICRTATAEKLFLSRSVAEE